MAYSAGANAPAPVADAAAADAPVLKRMQLKGHKDSVLCLAADGANSRLASGSADGMCRLWDLRSFRSVRAAQLPGDGADSEVCGVSLSSARPHLLLAAGGRQVYGFDLRSEKVILKDVSSSAECSRDDINQVLIDSNGHLCAVAEDTGAVHLLDLNTWRVDRTLFGKSGHENICSSVAWKPGRSWCLASGGLDAAVCFWQRSGRGRKVQMKPDVGEDSATATGPQLCNPPFVHSLAYLPDESLAAGLGDGTVALLDQTHSEISRLRGHSAAVAQVISAPFGLVSAGNDLQVVLWSTDPSSRLPLLQWRHHEKMNWLASAESRLMVAGLGNEIVVYEGLDR
eukprot:s291_g23.t1